MRVAALLLLVACAPAVPRVVTVVTPYTAVIPYDFSKDESAASLIGAVRCDYGGKAYILISSSLDGPGLQAVLIHEKVHVQQASGYGTCPAFRTRYSSDSTFRLQAEAQAYCAVLEVQRTTGIPPNPTYQEIVDILREKYNAAFTGEAVRAALPCSG